MFSCTIFTKNLDSEIGTIINNVSIEICGIPLFAESL